MSADSCIMPWVANMPSGSPSSRVEAARCLLASYLTPDRKQCAEAIHVLGVEWLRQQGLAPLTWFTCKSSFLPPDVSQQLQQSYYSAVGDSELHRRELIEVLDALAVQDITPVLLKGAALAHTAYPDPICRPMGDLDLWLTDKEMPRARLALQQLGYSESFKSDRPEALERLRWGEVPLHGQRPGLGLVELHWGLFAGEWLRCAAEPDEAGIRTRAVPVQIDRRPAFQLAAEDAIIQMAIHAAINHQMGLAAVRTLVDIALLVRAQPIDWAAVIDRANAWRVATATGLVLNQAVDLCGLHEAALAAQQLAPSEVRRRWLAGLVNADSLVEMRDLRFSTARVLLLLLLVDRGRDAVKLIFRALWPERDWLIARYGRYTLTTRLRHLFDAARGKI